VAVKQGGVWDPSTNRTLFKGVCSTMSVTVPARCCPWFAFADDGLIGPEGEAITTHRPVRVPIPTGAASVNIAATGIWRHAPTAAASTDPDGYGNPQPLVNAEYRSPAYLADNIAPPNPDPLVNTLVALFQPQVGIDSQIFTVGSQLNGLPLGNARGIFFGMWDGRQWIENISNSGNLTVTLVWST
jgi:hypothetical protein